MKNLTDKQKQILEFVRDSIRERGFPPSVRDICKHFNIQSPQGAQRHLIALEKKGFLKRDPRLARSLTLTSATDNLFGDSNTPPGETARWIPIVGNVAAGAPILAQEELLDQLPFSHDWLNVSKDYFLLRVKGDSMAESIQSGDMVLVERGTTAVKGEVVVALIDDEATCKRYHPGRGQIVLRSDNPTYADIIVSSDFRLLGKVKALVRKYQ